MLTRFDNLTAYVPALRRSKGVFALLSEMNAIWRQRKHLSALDPHMLKDIGVTLSEAKDEAERSFWDVPERWMR